MIMEVLKALLVGVIVSFPVGPVAMLVMQKTASQGCHAGYATGLGSAMADTLFALIGILAVGAVKDFFTVNEAWLFLAGGVVVAAVGLLMMLGRVEGRQKRVPKSKSTLFGYAIQAMFSVIANPGALFFSLAMVASFQIDAASTEAPSLLILFCVMVGAVSYWMLFVKIVDKCSYRLNVDTLRKASKIIGVLVIAFGLVLSVKGLMQL